MRHIIEECFTFEMDRIIKKATLMSPNDEGNFA